MLSIVSALLRPSLGAVCRVRRLSSLFAEDVSVPLCFARAIHGGQLQVLSSSWEACKQAYRSRVFPGRSIATCQVVILARIPLTVWGQLSLSRGFAATSKLRPKHTGGKLKLSGGYKERFKLTASGKILHMRTGHRHKRWPKSSDQNRRLRRNRVLYKTYATTLKKLGFARRTF